MRKISKAGLDLIKYFEGCRLYAYKPVPTEKWWTIGWGHYGPDVKPKSVITQADADAMLVKDMAEYESYVNNPAYVPITGSLNQNQFDALVSFCYNCGTGNLKTLCKDRTATQIGASIMKYDKAGGKVLAGLTRRRNAEWGLFNKPVAETKEDETVEKANVIVNGKTIADVKMINGTTYVPLRAVGEAWGATVDWNGKTNTTTVTK